MKKVFVLMPVEVYMGNDGVMAVTTPSCNDATEAYSVTHMSYPAKVIALGDLLGIKPKSTLADLLEVVNDAAKPGTEIPVIAPPTECPSCNAPPNDPSTVILGLNHG